MLFQSTLIATLIASATAAESALTSQTKAGSKLLSKARQLNGEYEADFSWMADYSLKFEGCHSIHSYGAEAQGEEEGSSPFGVQHLAKFKLCNSSKGCNSCSGGGEYIVELREFAESWLEAEQEIKEAKCATVEENCNCDYYYGDDQACLNKCYASAGLDYCGEDENQNNFDAAEYMECREADFGGDYGYSSQFFIGPICSSGGKHVKLAVFTDSACTTTAPSGTFEKYNYGYALPYSSESMISTSGCLSCKEEEEEQNNANGYYNQNANAYYEAPEPSAVCTELYEQSAKCENKMTAKNKYAQVIK